MPPSDDDLGAALSLIQSMVMSHPTTAQSIIHAFIREGRAYRETPDGRALYDRLRASEFTTRASILWEGLTLSIFDTPVPSSDQRLPALLAEALAAAANRGELEQWLAAQTTRGGSR